MDFVVDQPLQGDSRATLVFAHGAGAPMDSPFMQSVAERLAKQGCRVVRFEFPYMAQRRIDGKKRPPNAAKMLLAHYRSVIEAVTERWPEPILVGGKSMGGRMATMLVDCPELQTLPLKAGFCFGYPFHPAGKPERLRIEHLQVLSKPVLLLQGSRDSMGNQEEVANYDLSWPLQIHWLEDGNHDLKPRKASGHSHEQHIDAAVACLSSFVDQVLSEGS